MKKLLSKDLKTFKLLLIEEQGGLCPLTGDKLTPSCHLDHQHFGNGYCRAALSPRANRAEGKIINTLLRMGFKPEEYRDFLVNLCNHWEKDFSDNPIHPKEHNKVFETEKHIDFTKKEISRLKKARQKLKTDSAKERYSEQIQTLSERLKELNKQLKEENLTMAWKPEDGV